MVILSRVRWTANKTEKYHYFTWRPVVDLQLDRHGPTAFVVVIVHREKVIARCRRSETKQPAQQLLTKRERGPANRQLLTYGEFLVLGIPSFAASTPAILLIKLPLAAPSPVLTATTESPSGPTSTSRTRVAQLQT